MKFFGQIITGNTPPRNDADNYSSNFIEWIKTDNILANKTYLTKSTEYLSERGLIKARFVTPGALLVACIAGSIKSIGRTAIADRQVSFNQQINAIQPNDSMNSLFIYWLFKISKPYIQSHATKGMKKILTKGVFENILMITPPYELQNQFASIVEKVEGIKSHYQQSLVELENLYGSLSQQAFKGELDLSRVPIEPEIESEVVLPQNEESKFEEDIIAPFSDADIMQVAEILLQNPMTFEIFYEKLNDELDIRLESEYSMQELDYCRVKEIVFKQLEGDSPLLAQIFDEKENRIMLSVNR